mgnify:CR=1 FL=1
MRVGLEDSVWAVQGSLHNRVCREVGKIREVQSGRSLVPRTLEPATPDEARGRWQMLRISKAVSGDRVAFFLFRSVSFATLRL